jgi:hypothetical protein
VGAFVWAEREERFDEFLSQFHESIAWPREDTYIQWPDNW